MFGRRNPDNEIKKWKATAKMYRAESVQTKVDLKFALDRIAELEAEIADEREKRLELEKQLSHDAWLIKAADGMIEQLKCKTEAAE